MDVPLQGQPYEVRCHRCQCSFAPGTRRCLHCGGTLLPPGEVPVVRSAPRAGPPAEEAEDADEAGVPQPPSLARIVLWLVSAGLAIVLSALQTCHQR